MTFGGGEGKHWQRVPTLIYVYGLNVDGLYWLGYCVPHTLHCLHIASMTHMFPPHALNFIKSVKLFSTDALVWLNIVCTVFV